MSFFSSKTRLDKAFFSFKTSEDFCERIDERFRAYSKRLLSIKDESSSDLYSLQKSLKINREDIISFMNDISYKLKDDSEIDERERENYMILGIRSLFYLTYGDLDLNSMRVFVDIVSHVNKVDKFQRHIEVIFIKVFNRVFDIKLKGLQEVLLMFREIDENYYDLVTHTQNELRNIVNTLAELIKESNDPSVLIREFAIYICIAMEKGFTTSHKKLYDIDLFLSEKPLAYHYVVFYLFFILKKDHDPDFLLYKMILLDVNQTFEQIIDVLLLNDNFCAAIVSSSYCYRTFLCNDCYNEQFIEALLTKINNMSGFVIKYFYKFLDNLISRSDSEFIMKIYRCIEENNKLLEQITLEESILYKLIDITMMSHDQELLYGLFGLISKLNSDFNYYPDKLHLDKFVIFLRNVNNERCYDELYKVIGFSSGFIQFSYFLPLILEFSTDEQFAHIINKLASMIRTSNCCIFDIARAGLIPCILKRANMNDDVIFIIDEIFGVSVNNVDLCDLIEKLILIDDDKILCIFIEIFHKRVSLHMGRSFVYLSKKISFYYRQKESYMISFPNMFQNMNVLKLEFMNPNPYCIEISIENDKLICEDKKCIDITLCKGNIVNISICTKEHGMDIMVNDIPVYNLTTTDKSFKFTAFDNQFPVGVFDCNIPNNLSSLGPSSYFHCHKITSDSNVDHLLSYMLLMFSNPGFNPSLKMLVSIIIFICDLMRVSNFLQNHMCNKDVFDIILNFLDRMHKNTSRYINRCLCNLLICTLLNVNENVRGIVSGKISHETASQRNVGVSNSYKAPENSIIDCGPSNNVLLEIAESSNIELCLVSYDNFGRLCLTYQAIIIETYFSAESDDFVPFQIELIDTIGSHFQNDDELMKCLYCVFFNNKYKCDLCCTSDDSLFMNVCRITLGETKPFSLKDNSNYVITSEPFLKLIFAMLHKSEFSDDLLSEINNIAQANADKLLSCYYSLLACHLTFSSRFDFFGSFVEKLAHNEVFMSNVIYILNLTRFLGIEKSMKIKMDLIKRIIDSYDIREDMLGLISVALMFNPHDCLQEKDDVLFYSGILDVESPIKLHFSIEVSKKIYEDSGKKVLENVELIEKVIGLYSNKKKTDHFFYLYALYIQQDREFVYFGEEFQKSISLPEGCSSNTSMAYEFYIASRAKISNNNTEISDMRNIEDIYKKFFQFCEHSDQVPLDKYEYFGINIPCFWIIHEYNDTKATRDTCSIDSKRLLQTLFKRFLNKSGFLGRYISENMNLSFQLYSDDQRLMIRNGFYYVGLIKCFHMLNRTQSNNSRNSHGFYTELRCKIIDINVQRCGDMSLFDGCFKFVDASDEIVINLKDVYFAISQYYNLINNSVELLTTDFRSYFFLFEDTNETFISYLKSSDIMIFDRSSASEARTHWLRYEISTFEYLMVLNFLSGRSMKNVLSYPFLPWIFSDYHLEERKGYRNFQRPIGIVDDETYDYLVKLKRFRDNFLFAASPLNKYNISYFFVRLKNFVEIHKQCHDGSFDTYNRLFLSIPDSYAIATSNQTLNFELPPEFFSFSGFMINADNIIVSEKKLPDVALPVWCESPDQFVLYHRNELESDFVSKNISYWIDCTYGFKQKKLDDKAEYFNFDEELYFNEKNTESEIREVKIQLLGSMPIQLFKNKHPKRTPFVHREYMIEPNVPPYQYSMTDVILFGLVEGTAYYITRDNKLHIKDKFQELPICFTNDSCYCVMDMNYNLAIFSTSEQRLYLGFTSIELYKHKVIKLPDISDLTHISLFKHSLVGVTRGRALVKYNIAPEDASLISIALFHSCNILCLETSVLFNLVFSCSSDGKVVMSTYNDLTYVDSFYANDSNNSYYIPYKIIPSRCLLVVLLIEHRICGCGTVMKLFNFDGRLINSVEFDFRIEKIEYVCQSHKEYVVFVNTDGATEALVLFTLEKCDRFKETGVHLLSRCPGCLLMLRNNGSVKMFA